MKRNQTSHGLFGIFLLTFVGCHGNVGTPQGPISRGEDGTIRASATQPEDRRFELLLAGRDEGGDRAAEAREWLDLKHSNHALWKTDREQTLRIVNQLYAAGAAKVYAIYSPADETIRVNLCASLLIELPRDGSTREKALRELNRIDKEFWGDDHDDHADQGQKFIPLDMDT